MNSFQGTLPNWLRWETLQGYAETGQSRGMVAYPVSVEECRDALEFAKKNGLTICPRAGGFSYGDMILNEDHVVINLSRMARVLEWDSATGLIVVEPGVCFSDVFRKTLIHNWTLSSCPGGMGVTIGGAISNNVHGKDSWKEGNFGDQVTQLKLLTASGEIVEICRDRDRNLFEAVVGGIGLLGVIVEATLQLKKVPSPFVEVTSVVTRNIEESLEHIETYNKDWDFSVAWADAFAKGRGLGRGFVTAARWIDEKIPLAPERLTESLKIPTRIFGILPAKPTWTVCRPFFNPLGIRMANLANFTLANIKGMFGDSENSRLLFTDYNFMHNKIPDLKQVYRPFGFLEFQPIIPKKCGSEAMREVFEIAHRFGCQSLLCGVKAHQADDNMLSYSGDGYSLGIDVQVRGRNMERVGKFAETLFQFIQDCGGKTFLAKDELLSRDLFQKMYPRYDEFLGIKQQLDPHELFASDMYRRLLQPGKDSSQTLPNVS
jgi:decaprenylphospho-beta-D-ribofuranose 2-oxidase